MGQAMEKTSLFEKIGYGFAALGEATAYGFISVFLLFFLTTISGISPGIAGTIIAIGSIWNAFVNPIMGYFADKVYTKYGRRRPVMAAFSIPLMITLFLLFTNVEMPMTVKPFYYGMLIMLFWICYTGFFVPYLALGVDYTSDYNDRTVLRLFSSFFNMIGTMLSMVMPTMIVEVIHRSGVSLSRAWSLTGLLLGVIAFITIMITVVASKTKDAPCKQMIEKGSVRLGNTIWNIFREYASVAKLKPMKYLIIASLCSLICYTMVMSDMVYYLTYNKGFSATQISSCLLLRTLIAIMFIPIVGKLIIITDRRDALIGCYLFGSIGMCFIKFVSISDTVEVFLYVLFATVCTSIYWQIMPGIFYDVCEYDRIQNGRVRSATIVSFQGLVEALATGIGGQMLGVILETAGFNGDALTQSIKAQAWIENAGTVIPIVFLFIACIALYQYPINKKTYNEMIEQEGKR